MKRAKQVVREAWEEFTATPHTEVDRVNLSDTVIVKHIFRYGLDVRRECREAADSFRLCQSDNHSSTIAGQTMITNIVKAIDSIKIE